MTLDRRGFLKTLATGSMALMLPHMDVAGQQRKRPNVIVVYADDMGYGDVGCYGCKDIPTPHIDALAANGVRFTDGYVSCPQCAPSRAGLLTGRYPQRFGFEWNPPKDRWHTDGLPLDEACVAERMKQAGYATGLVGKWHLGAGEKLHPNRRGFDEFFGTLYGSSVYFPPFDFMARLVKDRPMPESDIQYNGTPIKETEYLTDAFSREATRFIDRHHKEPFFLYVPYTAPHAPLQAPERYLQRVSGIKNEKRRTYAAMVVALDDGIGAIAAKLREKEIEDSTVVFFISDNGATMFRSAGSNRPLRGGKGLLLEGGIRVPFVARWMGTLPAGTTYSHPVVQLDVAATAVTLAGGDAGNMDGVNLIPFLKGTRTGPPHETLYWRFCNFGYAKHGEPWQWAVRRGDWKLVQAGDKPHLFNLREDIGEKTELGGKRVAKAAELEQAYRKWASALEYPRWPEALDRVPWDGKKVGARGKEG